MVRPKTKMFAIPNMTSNITYVQILLSINKNTNCSHAHNTQH